MCAHDSPGRCRALVPVSTPPPPAGALGSSLTPLSHGKAQKTMAVSSEWNSPLSQKVNTSEGGKRPVGVSPARRLHNRDIPGRGSDPGDLSRKGGRGGGRGTPSAGMALRGAGPGGRAGRVQFKCPLLRACFHCDRPLQDCCVILTGAPGVGTIMFPSVDTERCTP